MTERILLLFAIMFMTAALTIGAVAQDAAMNEAPMSKDAALPTGFATNVCQSTYTSGIGSSYMKFCVTANGNVAQFISPQSFPQIYAEGYGVCDNTSSPKPYYDHEYTESGNWFTPSIVQPNGSNTFPLKIVRSTSDGVWTLTQTFSRNTTEQFVKVVMQVTNNSGASRIAFLERYADIDADGNRFANYSDSGYNSAWTYKDNYAGASPGHGVTLRALPSNFTTWANVIVPNGSTACSSVIQSGPFFGDGAVHYMWLLGSIPAYTSKSVTVEYRAM